ncbi:hypothetical protein AAFN86_13825 [Roseomonas sp. CAU 1739]|uniref:hypothetical protein n=1 Tax=Roseomonas sp. CAU 1739 TaxID=3140364 RepID=UPI00325AAC8E
MRHRPAINRRNPLPVLLLALALAGCAGGAREVHSPPSGCLRTDAAGLSADAASSVLRISVHTQGDGRSMHGTGFILHGSAPAEGTNRILTAVHVVSRALEEPDRAVILVARADGTPIGVAAIETTAEPWNPIEALDPSWTDQALLRIAHFATPAAEALFRAAPGLQPDPSQPTDALIDVQVTGSRGIEPGASGAPILGPDGRVRGVVVQRRLDHWARTGEDEIPAPRLGSPRGVVAARRAPPVREGIAQPIAAPMILAALGRQARDVDTVGAVMQAVDLPVLAPAFPARDCVVYRANAGYRRPT